MRWSILLKHIDGLTLIPLSETRWESRIDAIKPLRYQIGGIHDALYKIYEDANMDTSAHDEASGLLNQIKQFKFMCSIIIWFEILNRINPVSKMMQTQNFDLALAMNLLESTKIYFQHCRSDNFFNQVIEDAKKLADEINIDKCFSASSTHQPRYKKGSLIMCVVMSLSWT